jgi:hypothetical protein
MNFQLSAVFGYAKMGNEEAALQLLGAFLEVMKETEFPVVLHGDAYFDQINEWLDQSEIGTQLPRDSMKVQESLTDAIIDNPVFSQFKEQEKLQNIYSELRAIKKEHSKNE